jgi:hypothetical protein
MMAAPSSRFHGKLIGYLGFPIEREYIGERAAADYGPRAHTTPRHGQGVARTMGWCGRLLAPFRLSFGLHDASGKIGILAFVSSNSENISCVAFLKFKSSKN